MLTLNRIHSANHPYYLTALKLLEVSFPLCERRDAEQQRQVLSHPDYRLCAICDGGQVVGVVGYYDAADFVYFENFCIAPDKRNGGYGSQTLQILTDGITKPFILEAELPTDELTRRRIAFYKRNGMVQNNYAHVQPHYRKGDADVPLTVLTYRTPLTQTQYDAFRRYLDLNVDVLSADYMF